MLILTRRCGECVKIGADVTVAVLAVKGQQVRLGIGAPKNVPVHREEVAERIEREKRANDPNATEALEGANDNTVSDFYRESSRGAAAPRRRRSR